MRKTEVKQPHSGKRKRIPLDPNLQQGYPNKKEEVKTADDLYRKRNDDIEPDTIQNRMKADSEDDMNKYILFQSGKKNSFFAW